MDDWDLLEQFRLARPNATAEQAFGELVRRHAGFVLATCRRRLRDAHLSEDAAQAVFLVLARRPPPKLSWSRSTLAGWLYQTAIHACNNVMRANRSRAVHERQAAAVARQPHVVGIDHGIAQAEVEVLLDHALAELSSKERDAVLLRYYQDQSVQQVGAALGISQNTATKRIGRAIERMREFLAGKGLAITAPALIEAFERATRVPAPPEFLSHVISISTGTSVASIVVQQLTSGVIQMIRFTQIKLVGAIAAAVIVLGSGAIVAMTQQPAAPQPVAQAPATQPAAKAAKAVKASTPKEALLSLASAMRAGDNDSMRALVHVENADEQRLLDAACGYTAATVKFKDAISTKFGKDALKQISQDSMPPTPLENFVQMVETVIPNAEVQMDGSEAVIPISGNESMYLIQDGASWKMHAGKMTAAWTPDQREQRVSGIEQLTGALEQLTVAVETNQFATPQDLVEVLKQMFGGR